MLDNKSMITVVNKRKNPYNATMKDGEFYAWIEASDGYEDSVEMPFKHVQYLHSTSCTFTEGYLFIDNEEARKRLGLEKEDVKANQLSREDIEKLLKGNMAQLKQLGKITNRQLIRDAVEIAKEIKVENINKLQYLSEISGIPLELIIEKKDDEE